MVKLKGLFICVAAGLLVLSSRQAIAQQAAITIEVLATFDYPGIGNSTTAQGINEHGDIVGYFEDASGAIRSFIRFRNGNFSAPIVEPNDTGNLTLATDIDNSRRICGYFFDGTDTFHPYEGFFLSGSTFTEYGPAVLSRFVLGLTDAGDFCGSEGDDFLITAFVVRADGFYFGFAIGQDGTDANAINMTGQIVGDYVESDLTFHGYFRDSDRQFTFPLDFPGSTSTILLGLNDGELIVGKYVDGTGATHGLLLKRPNKFVSFDYPGATETSLNGINNSKLISGYYADASGLRHGFIARVGLR